MAANLKSVLNFKFTPLLFKNQEDFSSIHFFVCNPNDELKHLILKGGGHITENSEEADILLCEKKTDAKINDGYLPYDFIVDCIIKDTFLPLARYREDVLGLRASTSNDHTDSTDSSEEFRPTESSRVTIRNEDMAGRKKYTDLEDLKIIRYIITNDLYSQTGGNVVWKQMESFKVTSHTYQSMKSRFKLIIDRIDMYDIPDDWKAKLKGISDKNVTDGNAPEDDLDVETCSFGKIDEWKKKESEHMKGQQSLNNLTNDVTQCPDSSDEDLYTTDISPIGKLHPVNDSLSPVSSVKNQTDSSVGVSETPTRASPRHDTPHSDSSPSVSSTLRCNKHHNESSPSGSVTPSRISPRHNQHHNESSPSGSVTPSKISPRHNQHHNESSPSGSVTPARISPRHNQHHNESSPSGSVTPSRISPRHNQHHNESSPSGSVTPSRISPRHNQHHNESSPSGSVTPSKISPRHRHDQRQNDSSPSGSVAPARKSPRHNKHLNESSPSGSSLHEAAITKDQLSSCAPASSPRKAPGHKTQQNDSPPEQLSSPCVVLDGGLESDCSSIHLSCEMSNTDSEEQDSDVLSTELDFINEGLKPGSSTAQQEGCNREANRAKLERKIKFLTDNLPLETLEALKLLKFFKCNVLDVLEFLSCKD